MEEIEFKCTFNKEFNTEDTMTVDYEAGLFGFDMYSRGINTSGILIGREDAVKLVAFLQRKLEADGYRY